MKPNKLSLDQDSLAIVAGAVQETFNSFFGFEPLISSKVTGEVEPLLPGANSKPIKTISASMTLSQSETEGTMTLIFPFKTCTALFKNILTRDEITVETKDLTEGLGEIANVVHGLVKEHLNLIGGDFQLCLPTIIIGFAYSHQKYQLNRALSHLFTLKYNTPYGPFDVELRKIKREDIFEIKKMNDTINAMIDSLREGFVVLDKKGFCTGIASKKAVDFLGYDPKGKELPFILSSNKTEWPSIIEWYEYLFVSEVDFKDLADLGPNQLPHKHLSVTVTYKPLMVGPVMEGVVLIFTDITNEMSANKRAEKSMIQSEMIMKFFSDRNLFLNTLDLFRSKISQYTSSDILTLDSQEVLRDLHTMKGCASALFMDILSTSAHNLETSLIDATKKTQDPRLLRANIFQIGITLSDTLSQFLKENRAYFGQNLSMIESRSVPLKNLHSYYQFLNILGMREIREKYVDTIMSLPIYSLLTPLEQCAYSTARKLNKSIEVIVSCDLSLKIIPEPYRGIIDSLNHVINNALDHGIESSELRLALNKPEAGRLTIEVQDDEDSFIHIIIQDDGQGINPEVIREHVASKMGINTQAEDDRTVINRIFDIGFSTKSAVDELSGRGIGLNAVLTEAHKMNGDVKVSSIIGKGTTFKISLPKIVTLSYSFDEITHRRSIA